MAVFKVLILGLRFHIELNIFELLIFIDNYYKYLFYYL